MGSSQAPSAPSLSAVDASDQSHCQWHFSQERLATGRSRLAFFQLANLGCLVLVRGWAGSGSMDQLGRMPLRVFSIDKYAFQKKSLVLVITRQSRSFFI